MKRTTIHTYAALALLLGLAACTQDEAGFLPEGAEGTPIVFTATGLNPAIETTGATAASRATVDGDWKGVQTVAVAIGGEVKAYDVTPTTADNTSATLTSTDPHYWTNHDNITVTAWWPYTEGETTPPAVKVAADNPAEIAPYDKGGDTYTALVAPQSVAAGTAFITCKFTNGKVFVYKMENDADWQAGKEYTYTVSLAAAEDPGYTVSEDGKTYNVTSADGLRNVAKLVNEEGKTDINITLDTDLTLTGEWTPIGTESQPYTGTFNGGGKTITGLAVTGSDQYAGLFGRIGSGGTVKNVTLKDVKIESNHSSGYVGGVAGWSFGGNIENCSVSGSVSGSSGSDVGGVVGYQQVGSITGCSSSATVKGTERAGGVVGVTNGGATLTACYATGDVTLVSNGSDTYYAGGVVGTNGGGILTACYAWGSVTGSKSSGTVYVGGVTGSNDLGTLTACYHAKGAVSGPDRATGGVAGRNYKGLMSYGGIITACYWGSNGQEQGIGEDQVGTGGTTMVTDGDWQKMNAALSGKGWQYELKDGNSLPTLKKEQ